MHPCHELLHRVVPFTGLQLDRGGRSWLGRDRNVPTPTLEDETEVGLGDNW